MPAGLIFDLDGTLVDTVEARITAWLEAFAEAGIAADREAVAALIGSDGRRLAREVAGAAGTPLAPGDDERIDARSGQIYDRVNAHPRPLPGAREVLAAVTKMGVPWAIATSSRADQVSASLAALRLGAEPRLVTGSQVAHAKPAPDLLLAAAELLGAPPGDCWCVGDATWDMRAAVAAGMFAVGVTSGAVDAAALRAAGAAVTLAALDELLALPGLAERT